MAKHYFSFKYLKNLNSQKVFLFSLFLVLVSYTGFGQTYTDNTPTGGTETWTVPAGITSITVEIWGAGGAGGGIRDNSTDPFGGGGGGGGAYASSVINVTPGQTITYRVGVGGNGDTNDGNNGTNTWCINNTTVFAEGGVGGDSADNGGTGGTAGSFASSIGTTRVAGIDGANGSVTVGAAGGAGANSGGAGGAQRTSVGNGNNGVNPGGGGGGAFSTSNTDRSGGDGGDGQVTITWTVAPTGPANDICSGAIPITSNATCTPTVGSTTGATDNNETGDCTIGTENAVWYSFVATYTSHTVTVDGIAGFDAVIGALSNCGSTVRPTGGTCTDDTGNNGIETLNLSGLTINNTYYIQVYDYNGDQTANAFDICITDPPPPPANDECSGAIGLTVNADLNCGVTTPGTNVNATASPQADDVTGVPNDDVWFSFVATSTEHDVSLLNVVVVSGGSGMGIGIYDGGTAPVDCNALVLEDSQNAATSLLVSGLTVGNTYLVRVYGLLSGSTQSSTFDVCVGTTPACTAPNTPAGPITFGTITDDTINATFTGSTPVPDGGYLVLMNTTGTAPTTPTDATSYTIGDTSLGATVIDNDSNTTFSATGLTQTTTYFFFIYAFNNNNCNGGPAYSSTSLDDDATTVVPTYCIPSSTSSSNYIDDFSTTNGLTNITNNNTGYTTGGYADYSSMIASQVPGGNITFTADFIYGIIGMGVGIWVDWNNDLDFDDLNEQIYNSAGYIPNLNFNYTIPGVPAGTYRVRILADYWATSPNSCDFDSFGPSGEAEDYSLTITPLNCTDDPINVTAISTTPTTATISWTAPAATIDGYEYIISPDNTTGTPGNDIASGTTTGTSINVTGLTPGSTYYVFVRTDCNGTDFGIWITVEFSTACSDTVNTPNSCEMIISEAGVDPFAIVPFDSDPSLQLGCGTASLDLQTNAQMYETTSYDVIKIPYQYIASLGATLSDQAINDDDVWAGSRTNIGFDFCFYNNPNTQVLVGANGMITFNSGITPGSASGYAFSADLPSTAGALFEQTIYGVYHDLDPRGEPANAISTRVQGIVGCRKFIAEWKDIPMFGDATREYSGMIVLYETTNIIEVYIEEKRIENGDINPWNGGNALVGIQGDITPLAPNNQYATAPCRNSADDNWETFNEAWRFVPSGASRLQSVAWYAGPTATGAPLATTNTLTITSTGTYTAVSTYSTCGGPDVTLTDQIVVTGSNFKTWMGYIDDNWFVAGNWEPNGIPTASDCVLIPDIAVSNVDFPIADENNTTPLPPQPAYARNLTIAPTARLEVLTDTELVVTDWIHLDGTLDIKDSGSLIQTHLGTNNNTGNGVMNMQRTVPTGVNSYDYVYWSSPTDGDFDVTDISSATGELIYTWNPTLNGVTHGDWIPASGNMSQGKGYIVRGLVSTAPVPANTAEFSGKPQNGAITVPITRGTHNTGSYTAPGDVQATNEDDNWNLIGNPYPSAISYADFISANPHIDGTIYFWTHQTGPVFQNSPFYFDFIYNYSDDYIDNNYSGSNPPASFNGDIAAGQAFFVLMLHNPPSTGTSENVIFNNSMRNETLINSNFYRTTESSVRMPSDIERHRIWLDLIDPNDVGTSILVGYVEGATNGNDRLYDGYEFAGSNISFYSLIEEEKMAIQGKALPFEDADTVPLGVVIPENGNYSIAINTLDGLFENTEQNIYLEDTYNNFVHDLRLAPYSFNADAGTFNDRFILKYTNNALGVDEFDAGSAISITAPGSNYIKVTANSSPIKAISVYDVLGRTLYTNNSINALEFRIDNVSQSDGVLFVKAELENGMQKIQKVVIRQ